MENMDNGENLDRPEQQTAENRARLLAVVRELTREVAPEDVNGDGLEEKRISHRLPDGRVVEIVFDPVDEFDEQNKKLVGNSFSISIVEQGPQGNKWEQTAIYYYQDGESAPSENVQKQLFGLSADEVARRARGASQAMMEEDTEDIDFEALSQNDLGDQYDSEVPEGGFAIKPASATAMCESSREIERTLKANQEEEESGFKDISEVELKDLISMLALAAHDIEGAKKY